MAPQTGTVGLTSVWGRSVPVRDQWIRTGEWAELHAANRIIEPLDVLQVLLLCLVQISALGLVQIPSCVLPSPVACRLQTASALWLAPCLHHAHSPPQRWRSPCWGLWVINQHHVKGCQTCAPSYPLLGASSTQTVETDVCSHMSESDIPTGSTIAANWSVWFRQRRDKESFLCVAMDRNYQGMKHSP